MVSTIKEQVYNLLTGLGYQGTDNGTYQDNFPWLMVRTQGHNRLDTMDLRYDNITITIDIFSKYNGEKEILEIVEDIGNNIQSLKDENDTIIFIEQYSCKVLDDKKQGPVRKHGVLTYRFVCASGLVDKEATNEG